MRGCAVVDYSNVELLACPFCGEYEIVRTEVWSGFHAKWMDTQECKCCGAAAPVEVWNHRYTDPAQTAPQPEQSGHDELWQWFGLSYASWLTIPRVLMHAMPDDWQRQMAALLRQWDAAWNTSRLPAPEVSAKLNGKFTRWPEWLLDYRRPNNAEIEGVSAQGGDA